MRKTLVILTPAFPESEAVDYWVPTQQLLVRALNRNYPDWHIEVLSFVYPGTGNNYTWHQVPVTAFAGGRFNRLRRPLLWRNAWNKLKEIKSRRGISAILSFWCKECALVGSWFGKVQRVPHFCWICGQDARKTNAYVKWIRPKPGELVAISDFIARTFHQHHGIRPQHVIPNAIDETAFPVSHARDKDIDILGVGALIPLKQWDILIDTVHQLRADFPNIRAMLCGEGEEKERLTARIDQLSLQQHIRLTGAIHQRDVLQFMMRARVLVHPSSYEGFPTTCLEALYGGAQVVSFVKPMEHAIRNWHMVSTPEEMTAKVRTLLQHPPARREQVLVYSMNKISRKFMQLFDDAQNTR